MKFDHVSLAFGDRALFTDLSLRLTPGAVHCIVGKSGSGKTTILRMITGLQNPDNGLISGFGGVRMGIVFQEDRLIEHVNAIQNVMLVAHPSVKPEHVMGALNTLGITDYETPVRTFSGGEKRRVALIRALMHKPDLLLLDEPFKGLDAEMAVKAADFVRQNTDGATVLLVAHDREEALRLGTQHIIDLSL